ncbi:MAG: 5-formyltetrahydrofolate cyclo-ligase [Nitratiruptor sp.]|nr:5-formyltetrahydrofolate cyclo-ligase [Nitratiruptor sp.]NPA83258.1 5-formyltetrahydrofolate cyclo-ligase [Campylobacterota bacterium]
MDFASKEEFRTYCKARILPRKGSKRIQRRLAWLIERLGARRILAYVPMGHEPDIYQLLHQLRQRGGLVYVPRIEGGRLVLAAFRLPLKRGPFAIKEPPPSRPPRSIDLAIVPILGVDGGFRRIGFGQGMYDRLFARLPGSIPILFVQERLCKSRSLLANGYDIQGDFLVTPKEIYIRGDSDVGRDFIRRFCRHAQWRCRIFPRKKDRKGPAQYLRGAG